MWMMRRATAPRWEIHVTEIVFPSAPAEDKPRGAFASPFSEPFRVAAADGLFFFVTDSGAVYAAQETGGEWKSWPVWRDAARPVIAMLVLSDGATGYVFGKDFYFRLAKGIDLKPCRDVTGKETADAAGSAEGLAPCVRLIYECGRVLYEKGELNAAPERKK